jgi:N6-adenosine-specific RNA methylase IME4
MEFHEIANLFPMMQPDELADLVNDIKANGLIEPIILYEDQILDGRNRFLACGEAGVKPHYDYYKGNEPVAFVISKNLHRRHLNKSQEAMIATTVKPMLAEEARKRQAIFTGNQYTSGVSELIPEEQKGRSADKAGELFGVSGRYVSDAEKIKNEAPEYVEPIMQGEMTITRAKQEIKRKQVKEQLNDIEVIETKTAEGIFDVIVIDPPWEMKKIERNVAPNQVEFDYPTMAIDEIKALEVPCADDCHVWLWTTHKYLPSAFDILTTWGLKYICTFVWHKPGGFQPFGLPQYNSEFALYARKGSPDFTNYKDFKLCFDAPRTKHSEKPDYFYQLIKDHTAGRRLDMFNRRPIDGFETWGKEAR